MDSKNPFTFGVKRINGSLYGFLDLGVHFNSEITTKEPLPVNRWLDIAVSWHSSIYYLPAEQEGERPHDCASLKTGDVASSEIAICYTLFNIYIDGKSSGEYYYSARRPFYLNRKFYIGNSVKNGKPQSDGFSGYIDYIAFFSNDISGNIFSSFIDRPPFVLTHFIQSVYRFNENNPYDAVTSANIHFENGAGVTVIENTVAEGSIPDLSYDYNVAAYPQLSDYDRWAATVILDTLSLYMKSLHGLTPRYNIKIDGEAAYPDAVLAYAARTLVGMDESQHILAERNFVETNSANIAKLIAVLATGGAFAVFAGVMCIAASAGAGAKSGGGSGAGTTAAATAGKAVAKSQAVAAAGCIAMGAQISAKILRQITDKPPKPQNPTVMLKSIRFNHKPEGGATSAVNILGKGRKQITFPEWETGKVSHPCAYVQSTNGVPELEVVLNYSNVKSEPYSFILKGMSGLFGIFSAEVKFEAVGQKTVKVPLPQNMIQSTSVGKKSAEISWLAASAIKGYTFIEETQHTVYIIPQPPVAPFSIKAGESNKWLDEDLLSVCDKSFAGGVNSQQVMDALFKFIREDRVFKPSIDNQYASCSETAAGFNMAAFCSSFETGLVKLSVLDANALMALLCRANGLISNIAVIKSTLEKIYMRNQDGSINRVTHVLFTNRCCALNDNNYKNIENYTEHYVNTDATKTGYQMKVYDPYYTIDLGDAGKVGGTPIPFSDCGIDMCGPDSPSTYREAFFTAGCVVDITHVISDISQQKIKTPPPADEKDDADEQIFSLIGSRGTDLTLTVGRHNFPAELINVMPVMQGEHRCHSVSYSYIQRWIVEIINTRNKAVPPTHNAIMDDLVRLRHNMIFCGVQPSQPPPLPPVPLTTDYVAFLASIGAIAQEGIIPRLLGAQNQNDMLCLVTVVDYYLYSLNCAIPNLCVGRYDCCSQPVYGKHCYQTYALADTTGISQ